MGGGDEELGRLKSFFGDDSEAGAGGVPLRIGRFDIVREIGRGGMAVVYEAVDPTLGRAVALKVLKEGSIERLRREAVAAARLRHPNVVTVHEVGPDYIAMEYVEGRTLAAALPRLARAERLAIVETVARAVGHAHAEGVVHRDLKPENILIDKSGRVVLTDFGLAKTVDSREFAKTGAVIGTPHYMAPEQVRGRTREIGPPADVWALGVILYEAAVGKRPFEADAITAVYHQIVHDEPPPLAGDLGAVIAKALEKEPERRYPDARGFAEDVAHLVRGEPVAARPVGRAARTWRRVRRRPAMYVMAAGLVVAGAVAVSGLWFGARARGRVLDSVRAEAHVALRAALELRRAGALAQMRQFLPPLERAYAEVKRRAPELAEPDYLLGRMYRALLDDVRALALQDQALAKDQGFAPALYERAVLLSQRYGRAREASPFVMAGGTDDAGGEPPEIRVLSEAAARAWAAYAAVADPGTPAAVTDAGVAVDPERVEINVARGFGHHFAGRHPEARASLEAALRIDPSLEEAWEALGLVIRAQRVPDLASVQRESQRTEKLLTERIARDRGYLPHLLARGQLYISRANRWRETGEDPLAAFRAAIADFDAVIKLDPRAVEAWVQRGFVYIYRAEWLMDRVGDPRPDLEQAERDLSHAISLDDKHPKAWRRRGNARFDRALYLERIGQDPFPDFAAAQQDMSTAVRLDPQYAGGLWWRGYLRTEYAAARARHGEDPTPLFTLAAADFDASIAIWHRDPWAWWRRAQLHRQWGEHRAGRGEDPTESFAQAATSIERALRYAPDFTEVHVESGLLGLRRGAWLERSRRRAEARASYAAAATDFLKAQSAAPPPQKKRIEEHLIEARRKVAELDAVPRG